MDSRATSRSLLDIYSHLLAVYGPQSWWPAEEPFEVMVGAILTQSTAWRNVEKAIANLKIEAKGRASLSEPGSTVTLSAAALRHLSLSEIAALIYPSGYYNAKAHKLKALAHWLGASYADDLAKLFAQNIHELRRQLLSVYGIGPETADSIILYAAGQPIFVIDAYTRRITDRLGLVPKVQSYTAYQTLFMSNLPAEPKLFNEYHALLVQLGKDVCRKQPFCTRCCLGHLCYYN